MSPTLSSGNKVDEFGGGIRFLLPHRKPSQGGPDEASSRGCGTFALIVGLGFLAAYVFIVADAEGILGRVLLGAFVSPLALLGLLSLFLALWVTLGGTTNITLTPRRLILRERVGPIPLQRTIPVESVRGFRAHAYPGRERGALDIELEGLHLRRWAVEHPLPLLEELAAELTRALDRVRTGKAGHPGEVEFTPDGVRLTVRSPGWNLRAVAAAAGLAAVHVLFTVTLTSVAMKDEKTAVPAAIVVAAGWTLVTAFAVSLFRRAKRATILEYTDKTLRVTDVDPLGRRAREWPRSAVWGFEVDGPKSADGKYGPPELQARLSSGPRPVLVRGREGEELEWIASVLRRARPKPKEVEVVATFSPGGICQICGTGMEERVVWCARCRTPHHRECWDYTGMCSTFGCREIRFEGAAAPKS